MINIAFTCRITCKQVNKDLFFKIPVLRLSYFHKGKGSDNRHCIMILSYPYTIQLKIPFFRRLCILFPKAGGFRKKRFGVPKKTRRNDTAIPARFSVTACCQEKRSMISMHKRPLWYGHFQNPALSSLRLTVPSA